VARSGKIDGVRNRVVGTSTRIMVVTIIVVGSAFLAAVLGAYLQRIWTPDPRPEITTVGKSLGEQMRSMDARPQIAALAEQIRATDPRPEISALSTHLAEFQRRIEAIEQERTELENFTLELRLQQAQQANYILSAKNDSDRDIKAEAVSIEYQGIPLCRPTKPKEGENWTIKKHSGIQIFFAPQPDPIAQLMYTSIAPPSGVAVPMTLVVLCRIDGKLKPVKGIQIVTVDIGNRSMTPFGP
jgi:hypothetical protein